MKRKLLLKTMLLLCALMVGSRSVWADTVTFSYEDYKGKGTTSNGSEYTMVKTDVSIGDTKFFGNNSQAHFYANGVTTITPATGVTITQIVLTATAASYNGFQSSGTVTPSIGTVSKSSDGLTVTWTGSATSAFTISHNKQIRWTSIVVTYSKANSGTTTITTIDDSNLTNTDVYTSTSAGTLSAIVTPEGGSALNNPTITWSSSDTDVATIDANGAVTLVAAGTTTITASYAGVTDQYAASSDTYELTVTSSAPYVQPTTVVVNMNYAWLGSNNGSNLNASQLPVVKTQDNVTITITDGTSNRPRGDTDYVRIYNGSTITFDAPSGYIITEIKFTTGGNNTWSAPTTSTGTLSEKTWTGSAESVIFTLSGSCFISKATITITPLGSGVATTTTIDATGITNTNVYTSTAAGSLSASVTVTEGGAAVANESVTWSGDNDAVATIDASTGAVTLVAAGTVTFIASYAGVEDEYLPSSATYEMTVTYIDPNAPGSQNNPYTVAQVIALNPTSTSVAVQSDVYVKGFIIGAVDNNSGALKSASESNSIDTNLAIADNPTETTNYCTVQLPSGTIRDALKTKNQIYNIGVAQILVKGNIKKYCGKPGIRDLSEGSKVAEQISVSSVGVATYSTDVALDFTNTGITAYTAVANATSVSLTPIEGGVPANTGVVLKANGGANVLVPVASSTATPGTNEMVANVSEAEVAEAGNGGKTNYILSNETAGVGFYLAAESGATLPAHRAYLSTTEAKSRFMAFANNGEATGISSMHNSQYTLYNEIYNLNGQRVSQPKKGLYIVNGKKVIK